MSEKEEVKSNINYYEEIKRQLINNEVVQYAKDYSKNKSDLESKYNVGKLLAEAGKCYGENIIGQYAKRLMVEVGKKYTRSTLFRMRQFYEVFSNEKVAPLVRHLTWSHYLILMPLKNLDKINYYITQIVERRLSKRGLQEIIKNQEYERLPEETKQKLIEHQETRVTDLIKNPIIIKNNSKEDDVTEKALQRLILEDIQSFLMELGSGFCFIASEYKIKIGNTYNYIDLLLYNIEFNCYIVIELKVTSLKKEHIGQVEVYMNYIDTHLKKMNQDKTIGIIICKKNNQYVIEYASDKRILAKEYELV